MAGFFRALEPALDLVVLRFTQNFFFFFLFVVFFLGGLPAGVRRGFFGTVLVLARALGLVALGFAPALVRVDRLGTTLVATSSVADAATCLPFFAPAGGVVDTITVVGLWLPRFRAVRWRLDGDDVVSRRDAVRLLPTYVGGGAGEWRGGEKWESR